MDTSDMISLVDEHQNNFLNGSNYSSGEIMTMILMENAPTNTYIKDTESDDSDFFIPEDIDHNDSSTNEIDMEYSSVVL